MDYTRRVETLLAHRIGLWDVIAQARREGSLDSRIRDHATNDVAALVAALPNLAAVAFNGGTAAKNSNTFTRVTRLRIATAPSTSTPWIWNTDFAISRPIVITSSMDGFPRSGSL